MRNKLQVMSDRLLLLYAISKGNEFGEIDGNFKLMKIPFMAELTSTRAGINTFGYSFFRWDFGPLSTEIYEDADALSDAGLSTPKDANIHVTPKGERLLANVSEIFEANSSVVEFVESAAREYSPLGFGALKQRVYKEIVVVNGKYKTTIEKAPKRSNVGSPLPYATSSFVLDDDWIDTLWGQFNYSTEELLGLSIIRPMASLFESAHQ